MDQQRDDDDAPRLPGDLVQEHAGRLEPEPVAAVWRLDDETRAKRLAKRTKFILRQQERGRRRAAKGGGMVNAPPAKPGEFRPGKHRCTAAKRDGSRCRCAPIRGSDRCYMHEGLERAPESPAAIKAALAGRPVGKPRHRFATHPSAKAKRAKAAKHAPRLGRKRVTPSKSGPEPET